MIVTAIDYNDPPARMNGNEVVLFLKQIPDSDAYSTVRASGVFELDGHSVTPTSNDSLPSSMSRDKRSFLELLRVTCGKS